MIVGHALLIAGVALYALAGSILIRRIARGAADRPKHRRLRLLPPALGAVLALVCLVGGLTVVCGDLSVPTGGLPLWLLSALCVVPLGLLASSLLVLAVLPPPGGDDGGSGPDDPPPPPDPDGPDGWAEFERQFRAYARARDARRTAVPVR